LAEPLAVGLPVAEPPDAEFAAAEFADARLAAAEFAAGAGPGPETGTVARAAWAPGMAEIGREEPSTRSGTRPEPPGLTGRADPLARPDETEAEPLLEPVGGAEAEPLAGGTEPDAGALAGGTDADEPAEPAGRTRAEPLAEPGGVGLTEAEPLTDAEPLAGPLAGAEPLAEPLADAEPLAGPLAGAEAPGTVARPLTPLVGALAGLPSSSGDEAGVAQRAPGAGGGGGA
jgi:hypothetical protein